MVSGLLQKIPHFIFVAVAEDDLVFVVNDLLEAEKFILELNVYHFWLLFRLGCYIFVKLRDT